MSNYGAVGIVAAVLLFLVIRERMEDRKAMERDREKMDARIEAFAKITTTATSAIEESTRVNREVADSIQTLSGGFQKMNDRLDHMASRLDKIDGGHA